MIRSPSHISAGWPDAGSRQHMLRQVLFFTNEVASNCWQTDVDHLGWHS